MQDFPELMPKPGDIFHIDPTIGLANESTNELFIKEINTNIVVKVSNLERNVVFHFGNPNPQIYSIVARCRVYRTEHDAKNNRNHLDHFEGFQRFPDVYLIDMEIFSRGR